MAFFLSPFGNTPVTVGGVPVVGGSIKTYLAGTSTPAETFTDNTGSASQGVSMTLNEYGLPENGPVWMLSGQPLKFRFFNAMGVSILEDQDDISGIGDSSSTPDQFPYVAGTPTYISATSFSIAGDQTNDAQISRRVRSLNNGGTVYSTITNRVFAAGVTTVTVSNDSGVLDIGLSQVNYSLLTPLNPSVPATYAASGANSDITSLAILPGYLFGCTLSTAGSSATMSIAAGRVTDSTGLQSMALAAIAKTTSAWAAGSAQGGLDTGAIANSTWYHFYVIRRPDTGVVDVLFSLSATAPALPANYTQFRRIGSGKTSGAAQWVQFMQYGDDFEWVTPVLDITAANPTTAAVTRTLASVPTGVTVKAKFNGGLLNGTASDLSYCYFSSLDTADLAPSASVAPLAGQNYALAGPGGSEAPYATHTIRTNTAAQIRSRASASAAGITLRIATLGWTDDRGRTA